MKKSLYIARGGLITAITVLIIYVSYLMPGGRLAAFTAVSFLPLILLKDRAVLASIACYAACTLLIFLIIPNPVYFLAYGLFFGLFPLMRHLFEHSRSRILYFILLALYCEAAGVSAYFSAGALLGPGAVAILPFWALAAIAQAGIAFYIWLYEYCARYFISFAERLKIFRNH